MIDVQNIPELREKAEDLLAKMQAEKRPIRCFVRRC